MKYCLNLFGLCVLCISVFIPAVADESHEGKYLFEILDDATYLKTWDALIASQKDAPLWLKQYGKTRNGPATPGEPFTVADRTFEVYMVCKTHDCGGNQFHVIFLNKGTIAYGLLLQDTEIEIFGEPDNAVLTALKHAQGLQ
ncbi:hypothetical protein KDN34_09280 [Shewanella yunxiaonensis]|uniref:Inhibitor of vertebrate lysozyme (Ivy) n=1 Tax=Shewanella yunxiaonensis TaxID=2829809 RepID=A0ABX7YPM1_9GAMM|nr:Ivy family c-type lysozyme inhibitor [Shewanella yunxiaonensis]QUN04478.1 hypothetical protein KDN34_09280 [Shewanella yunxiaonensis]